jgi:hypothetical protein
VPRSLIVLARRPVFRPRRRSAILAGEITVAEAAWQANVSEQSVGNRKPRFLQAGKSGLGR